MARSSGLIAGIVLLTALAACQSDQAAEAPAPTVCDVVRSTEAFEGQTVTLSGQLFSDFHHGSGITDIGCLDDHMPLGISQPNLIGNREFFEAWRVSASCPSDTLFFTVTGRIERQDYQGHSYLALAASEFSNMHRREGSDCPLTIREYQEQLERNE
jgi:hypothetical protein